MTRQLTDPDLAGFEHELIARVTAALQLPLGERAQWFETVAQAAAEADREQAARDWKKLVAQCAGKQKTERRKA
jgi:hypothetical protein